MEFDQQSKVTFINPDWENFIQPNGTISHRDMYDYMHPTESGYAKLADPLIEELQNSLQTFLKTNAPSNSFVEESWLTAWLKTIILCKNLNLTVAPVNAHKFLSCQ